MSLSIRAGDRGDVVPVAFSHDVFSRFVSYIDAKPATVATYTKALRRLSVWLADQGISRPERGDLVAWREWLRSSGHRPATIQGYMTAARLFFRWTEQEGIYPNIADHLKGAKISRDHKKDYLTPEQVRDVLACPDRGTLRGLRDYAILFLMVTGGLRTVEVARADVADLRTSGAGLVLYIQGKGRDEKAEYIKISRPVEEAIRAFLRARGAVGANAPLFASLSRNSAGERMTTRAISGLVKRYMVQAGYNSPRLTAHSLRHTAVTLSLAGGEDLQKVQQFARHANIATTLIYAHNLDRADNKCEETITAAIFGQ